MEIDSSPPADLITALGYMCLGSRLKRLGERMQAGVAAVLAEQGHEVQPAQLPILMALHVDGAMTINALSERVGISQPGISRAIATLLPLGIVELMAGGRDKRQRTIGLTASAQTLMNDFARTLFPAVDRAVGQACDEADSDLLGALAQIEQALAREPLDARIVRELGSAHG